MPKIPDEVSPMWLVAFFCVALVSGNMYLFRWIVRELIPSLRVMAKEVQESIRTTLKESIRDLVREVVDELRLERSHRV